MRGGEVECCRADVLDVGSLRQIHPAIGRLNIARIARNLIVAAQRRYPLARRTITSPGEQTITVEGARNKTVRTNVREHFYRINDLIRYSTLTAASPR